MKNARALAWMILGAVAAVTASLYWPALAGPFLLDDFDAIFPLAAHQSSGADWLEVLRNAPSHIRARSLSNFTFLLSNTGGAMPPLPFAFKLGNLLAHLACGAAVFALAQRVLAVAGETRERARLLAVLAAALFLLHPLLVSTVLYPVQRMAQLSTLFLLLSAYAYVGWRRDLASFTPGASVVRLALCAGLALLAFAAKENGVLAPLLFATLELSLFRWPPKGTPERTRFDTGFGLLIAAPLMLGLVALILRWPRMLGGYGKRGFTMLERVLTEIHVLGDYLAQIVLPRIGGMGLYHDDFPVQTQPGVATVLLALAFACAIVAAVAMRRRFPVLALGVLWFFAAHALESTIIALELVFEHRNYLALFGPALIFAWAAGRLPRPAFAAAFFVMLATLSVQTARRAQEWRDYSHWIASEVRNHPASLRAGTEMMLHHASNGRLPQARAERERLAAAMPGHAQPLMLKLAFACREAQAAEVFTAAELQSLRGAHAGKDMLHVFGSLRDRLRRHCKTPDWRVFAAAAEALAQNPEAGATRDMRANWWRLAAGARLQVSDWPAVRIALEHALQAEDNDPRDWLLLAEAQARLGNRAGYLASRQRFLALMGGSPGQLADGLARADAAATAPPLAE